jgi:putative alpha-1,2-mannosidase
VFYTALYHALLQPLTGSDADGRYRGYDNNIHTAKAGPITSTSRCGTPTARRTSCWRCCARKRTRDIANSVLKIREQGGWLPRWGYANFETNIMTGDPVTPFLVDLWRFGALPGREREAYTALRRECLRRAALQLAPAGPLGQPQLPAPERLRAV